jgi:RNA polymerase sigma-70 factor (ECF subfamily)
MDLDTLVMHPVYEYDPAEEQEKKSIKALVESGLEMIPELYKEILILYYIEELSYQEIADILHVPMGTVSVRIRRGKEALKKKLQHKWI